MSGASAWASASSGRIPRTIATTGWYGAPEHATVDKALRMLNEIADSISREATDIFRMLDEAHWPEQFKATFKDPDAAFVRLAPARLRALDMSF